MTCECGLLHERGEAASCGECGTACCRSCRVEIEAETYCRWCATLRTASA